MMLSPLVQAGALQNSQSPVDAEGAVMAVMDPAWNFRSPAAGQFCSLWKVNNSERPDCGLSQRPGHAVRTPIAWPKVGSA